MNSRSQSTTCAFCGERFPVVHGHVLSWRVGDRYACNEFCAEGVEAQASRPQPSVASPEGREGTALGVIAAAQSSASRPIAALFSRQ
jgi:hypothetical protein